MVSLHIPVEYVNESDTAMILKIETWIKLRILLMLQGLDRLCIRTIKHNSLKWLITPVKVTGTKNN